MTELDYKIKNIFPEESMKKTPDRYKYFSGVNVPSFIKDWLLKKFSDVNDEIDTEALYAFIEKHIPTKDSGIRSRLLQGEQIQILARILFDSDIKSGEYRFQVPDIGIKSGEGKVSPYLVRENVLKEGENWGIVTMNYVAPEGRDKGYAELIKFKPFRPYRPNYDYYCEARRHFSTGEWIDFLIKCMEYNPDSDEFVSTEQKLLFLTRLLVFIEPNLNLIELAPKGTGKSYVFNNLSKYGWQISGGKVTRAKLFYDMGKHLPGIIPSYEFVSMDEIKTITFDNPEELQGAMKNYLESGSFTVGESRQSSLAGLALLGNIDLGEDRMPLSKKYFNELPEVFHDTALLDRFHGFIEGWYLPRVTEDLKLEGYSLNVEYFSEIMSYMRNLSIYREIVNDYLDIPKNSDTRDTTAIIRLASGYLKLLFPNAKSVKDISPEDFSLYCFEPAFRKRAIIRQQLSLLDAEYSNKMPNIKVRGL